MVRFLNTFAGLWKQRFLNLPIFHQGWIEDFYSESTKTIAEAYIQRGDHNIS